MKKEPILRKNAFTLIELLIVIAIVALLAGVMVPVFRTTRYDAQRAKTLADLEALKTALRMFHFDTGTWPIHIRWRESLLKNEDFLGDPIPGWGGPYIDEFRDDPWGRRYTIWSGGTPPREFVVFSYGPHEGFGPDDIRLIVTPDSER